MIKITKTKGIYPIPHIKTKSEQTIYEFAHFLFVIYSDQ